MSNRKSAPSSTSRPIRSAIWSGIVAGSRSIRCSISTSPRNVDDDSVGKLLAAAEAVGVTLEWVLETHPCRPPVRRAADQGSDQGQIAIREHVRDVQNIFSRSSERRM